MKVLVSNTEQSLITINDDLTQLSGISTPKYTVCLVLQKFDETGFWYNIEAACKCSTKPEMVALSSALSNGEDLPQGVVLVDVVNFEEEGFLEEFS